MVWWEIKHKLEPVGGYMPRSPYHFLDVAYEWGVSHRDILIDGLVKEFFMTTKKAEEVLDSWSRDRGVTWSNDNA